MEDNVAKPKAAGGGKSHGKVSSGGGGKDDAVSYPLKGCRLTAAEGARYASSTGSALRRGAGGASRARGWIEGSSAPT